MIKIHIEYMANNYLTRYKPIENIAAIISGSDIMELLNISEGHRVGEAIEEVKKAIYFGKISATKDAAIEFIKAMKNEFINKAKE